MSTLSRLMQFLVWSSTLASAACTQHEAPAPTPQRQAQGVVIDDSGLCLYVHDWWQQNSQRFLHTGLRRLPLSDAMVERHIVPALREALDKVAKSDANGDGDGDTATDDLVGACLIALARIGREVPRSPLADTFAGYLRHPNQAVREAAALALGMAGVDGPRERDLLVPPQSANCSGATMRAVASLWFVSHKSLVATNPRNSAGQVWPNPVPLRSAY